MTETTAAQDFWEDFYQERDQVWTGKPNALLVREVAALPPGSALDVGCAEGADAIWLAERGWQVTGVDVSATALNRAAARAAEAGVTELIDFQRHDLSVSFPAGEFDLVSAQFLHSPIAPDGEREAILRRAAAAVAPGGVLLIVGHAGWPTWRHDHPEVHLPTTAEVLEALRLEPGAWRVEVDELVTQDWPGPDGQPGSRVDNVLRIRRA
jgi:SAM-dependent methyltransferase